MKTTETDSPRGIFSFIFDNSLLRALRNVSSEQEQSVIRVIIQITFLGYWVSGPTGVPAGSPVWITGCLYIATAILFGAAILALSFALPRYKKLIRVVAILADTVAISVGLALTGAKGAPWYGLYLWFTLGNGFRYGEKYLYLSGSASLLGFGVVVSTSSYWAAHSELAIGLAATLLVIPAYSATLIRRLNEARRNADAASRAKSDFLSRMSHEIRTPLNGILGMTDLLRTRPLDPEDREYVEAIHASGKTLAYQIDEILDLSKIEAGQLSLERLEFDLYALINTTLRIFEPQVGAKQLELQETINPTTPFLLCGDPHKLRQIIINLMGNAIKFTERGFVSLRVYPRAQEDDRVTLRFEVADTGAGISADRLEHIFEPFTQADSSVSRLHGGTGLGTTICKNLVELMGGDIGVQSTPDVGTTFWFDVPFETGKSLTPDAGHSWAAECNVLYLPGENRCGKELETSLREWRLPFKTVPTLAEARQFVEAGDNVPNAFDALILDGVPYGDELEGLLSLLGRDPSFTALPLVLVGAENYPPEIARRAHDHLFVLHNPLDKRVLFNTLHACYSRHSTEDDIVHIARQQVREQRTPLRSLNVLIADDNATNRLVLERMLRKMGYQCSVVTGGEEVLTALEHSQYDIAIVDKNMPDMNGVDVFNLYSAAHGGQPPTRFVILTADATAECRDTCKAAGIEYFLTKPVSLARLQETLSHAMTSAPEVEKLPGTSGEVPAAGSLAVVNAEAFEKLELLAGDDHNFMRDIIANFEKDADQDIRGLEIAIANRDWLAYRDSAHALKGAALYLGLSQLAELSAQAQNLDREEFECSGIERIRAIRKATDQALGTLEAKLQAVRKSG